MKWIELMPEMLKMNMRRFHTSSLTRSFSLHAVYLHSDLRSCLTSYGLLSDGIPWCQRHRGYSEELAVLSEHHELPPVSLSRARLQSSSSCSWSNIPCRLKFSFKETLQWEMDMGQTCICSSFCATKRESCFPIILKSYDETFIFNLDISLIPSERKYLPP